MHTAHFGGLRSSPAGGRAPGAPPCGGIRCSTAEPARAPPPRPASEAVLRRARMILRRARVMPAESVFTHGQGPSSSRGVFQKQMTNDATNATMSLQEGQTWGGLDLELGLPPPPSLLLPLPVSLLYTPSFVLKLPRSCRAAPRPPQCSSRCAAAPERRL